MNRSVPRLSLIALLAVSALAPAHRHAAELPAILGAPTASWMSFVPDATPLTRLSIPGTHDSGATKGVLWYVCQKDGIAAQLSKGIRFLDVRCRHIGDRFAIHHEAMFEGIMFGDVLNDCKAFLAANPKECVIMTVKSEYGEEKDTRSFKDTFDWYVKGNPGLFCDKQSLPTLGEARGKIVVLRRFAGGSVGVRATPWKDDTTYTIPGEVPILVQDRYGLGADLNVQRKWKEAEPTLISTAALADQGSLCINFMSASGSSVDPADAWSCGRFRDMKEHLNVYLDSHPRVRTGIVAMDFPDAETIRKIIWTNAAL